MCRYGENVKLDFSWFLSSIKHQQVLFVWRSDVCNHLVVSALFKDLTFIFRTWLRTNRYLAVKLFRDLCVFAFSQTVSSVWIANVNWKSFVNGQQMSGQYFNDCGFCCPVFMVSGQVTLVTDADLHKRGEIWDQCYRFWYLFVSTFHIISHIHFFFVNNQDLIL